MARSDASPPAKKGKGRKKIEMKLIKKMSSRMVTFSKRRASLFRKASEFATQFNAHVAIMMFSPGGKIYSFGHPSVTAVVERYESSIRNIGASPPDYLYRAEFRRLAAVRAEQTLRLRMELQRTQDDIEAKKSKIKMLDRVWEKEHAGYWWNGPIEEMDMVQCKELERKLMELRMEVDDELKSRNQAEDSKKDDLVNEATKGKMVVAPNMRDQLAPNRSAGVLPNNLVAEWINSAANSHRYMPGSSNAISASNMTNFNSTGFYNSGGARTSNSASMPGSSSSSTAGSTGIGPGVGPKGYGPNFNNNFPF